MKLFDSALKSIQNSLFLKENESTFKNKENESAFSKVLNMLSPDERTKVLTALMGSTNSNNQSQILDPQTLGILKKLDDTYISSLTPKTSAGVVSKEVTVPGGVAPTPNIQPPNAAVSSPKL